MKTYLKILLLALLVANFACSQQNTEENPNKQSNLPDARGEVAEIFLLMDSAKWHSKLGETVRNVLNPPYEGLLKEEPSFKIRWINPTKMIDLLNKTHTLVYVTTFDSQSAGTRKMMTYFTQESVEQIKNDPNKYYQINDNVFANNQKVFQFFSKTEEQLIEKLEQNAKGIYQLLQENCFKIIHSKIYKAGEQKKLTQKLNQKHGFTLRIPFGYEFAKEDMQQESGFVFLRKIDGNLDHNLFIAYKPYKDTLDLMPEKIQAWRDTICKKYIFDIDKPESYVVTETLETPLHRKTAINNMYAVEMRGLWRTSVKSMGGTFVSYTVVDTKKELLYYIEGFIYAPGKNKREYMREVDAILHTFKP